MKTVSSVGSATENTTGSTPCWARTSTSTVETDVPGAQQATRVDSTVVVEVQAQTGVLPLVFSAAERHGFEVSDLSITEPTLETVFINLTGKDLRE